MSNDMPQSAPYRGKLKAVVLDWAGTTVDFGSLAPVRTLQKVFASAHVDVTEAEARLHMGLPKKDHIRQMLRIQKVQEEWKRAHGNFPVETDVEQLYQQFIPLQFACLLDYSAVIPGVVEATERFRKRGLKIGSTTGYTREMLDLLVEAAKKSGYAPDCSLSPQDVGAGRPHPYMMYEAAVRLQVYPMSAMVKIGDTPVDIQEALNAGAWSIGVAATGNMMGLSQKNFAELPKALRDTRLAAAREELKRAGAHYVVNSVAEVDSVLDEIDARLQGQASVTLRH